MGQGNDEGPKRQPLPPSRQPVAPRSALELSDLRPTDTSQKHGRESAHLLDGAVLLPAVTVDLLVLIVDAKCAHVSPSAPSSPS